MNPRHYILAVLSGILLFLSFPNVLDPVFPAWSGYLAWVALVPLFFAINKQTFPRVLLIGFITGFVFFAGLLYWILYIKELGALAWPLWLLLSCYLALYVALFASSLRFAPLMAAPFLWVASEYLRGMFLTGFPWGLLGYSQYKLAPLLQLGSLTGVYGVSFVVVLVNTGIAYFFIKRKEDKAAFLGPVLAALALIAVFTYGLVELNSMEHKLPAAAQALQPVTKQDSVSVCVLQGNIAQDVKWDEKFTEENFKTYKDLALSNKEPVDLYLWPESASTVFLRSEKKYAAVVAGIAQASGAPQFVGTPDAVFGKDGRVDKLYVSAFLYDRYGRLSGAYNKTHLVPFGEYIPLRNILKGVSKLEFGITDYSPGSGSTIFTAVKRFSPLICYEVIFPEIARQRANEGAEYLVNITNDAWYQKSAMPYQHFSMLAFRAVETRLNIARAANTGISGYVNYKGEIAAATQIFEKTKLKFVMPVVPGRKTVYMAIGDMFAYLCVVLGLASFLVNRKVLNG